MGFVLTGTLTTVILGILTLATNYSMAQTANVTAGFIPNPSKGVSDLRTTDPNYNMYQNLALGFNIKYLKNMTINQGFVNSTANTPDHFVRFQIPVVTPFKDHLSMIISVIPETGFLGVPYNLDQAVTHLLMNSYSGNNTIVTNKTKGILNGFPAYKIDSIVIVPKVFKNITSSLGFDGKPITHQYQTLYLTFRNGIGYWIQFYTYSPDRFNPVEKTMTDSFRYN
jgi:hypothetical protein